MFHPRLDTWLRRLRATATFVSIAAICLAVAVLVIAVIPGSPVVEDLPARTLGGLGSVTGVTSGVHVDHSGRVTLAVDDPSLAQRLLHLLTVLPGLVLIAEIARRMAHLLRVAVDRDPFTESTARALVSLARLTAIAGLSVWIVSQLAQGILNATMVEAGPTFTPHHSPLGWFAVSLILAGFGLILDRGVAMRTELDAVI